MPAIDIESGVDKSRDTKMNMINTRSATLAKRKESANSNKNNNKNNNNNNNSSNSNNNNKNSNKNTSNRKNSDNNKQINNSNNENNENNNNENNNNQNSSNNNDNDNNKSKETAVASAAEQVATNIEPKQDADTDTAAVCDVNELCRSCGKKHNTLYKLFKNAGDESADNAVVTASATTTTTTIDVEIDKTTETSASAATSATATTTATNLTTKISKTLSTPTKTTPTPTTTTANPIANATVKAIIQGQNNMDQIQQELLIWQLGITENDGLPQSICAKCTAQFYMIHKFRRKCLKVQIKLRQFYAEQIKQTTTTTTTATTEATATPTTTIDAAPASEENTTTTTTANTESKCATAAETPLDEPKNVASSGDGPKSSTADCCAKCSQDGATTIASTTTTNTTTTPPPTPPAPTPPRNRKSSTERAHGTRRGSKQQLAAADAHAAALKSEANNNAHTNNSYNNNNNCIMPNEWRTKFRPRALSYKHSHTCSEFKMREHNNNDMIQESLLEKVAQLSIYDKDSDSDNDSDSSDSEHYNDTDNDSDDAHNNGLMRMRTAEFSSILKSMNSARAANGISSINSSSRSLINANAGEPVTSENEKSINNGQPAAADTPNAAAEYSSSSGTLEEKQQEEQQQQQQQQQEDNGQPKSAHNLSQEIANEIKNVTMNNSADGLLANECKQMSEITVVTKAARKEYANAYTAKRNACQMETIAKVTKLKIKRKRACHTKMQLIKNPLTDGGDGIESTALLPSSTSTATATSSLCALSTSAHDTSNGVVGGGNDAMDIIKTPDIMASNSPHLIVAQRCRRADKRHANDATHSINPCSVRLRRVQLAGQHAKIKQTCKPKNTRLTNKMKNMLKRKQQQLKQQQQQLEEEETKQQREQTMSLGQEDTTTAKTATTTIDATTSTGTINGICSGGKTVLNGVAGNVTATAQTQRSPMSLPVRKSFWRTKAEMKQNANLHKLSQSGNGQKMLTLREAAANALKLFGNTNNNNNKPLTDIANTRKPNAMRNVNANGGGGGVCGGMVSLRSACAARQRFLAKQRKFIKNYLRQRLAQSTKIHSSIPMARLKALHLVKMSVAVAQRQWHKENAKRGETSLLQQQQQEPHCQLGETHSLTHDRVIAKLTENLSHGSHAASPGPSQIIVRVPLAALSEDFRLNTLQQHDEPAQQQPVKKPAEEQQGQAQGQQDAQAQQAHERAAEEGQIGVQQSACSVTDNNIQVDACDQNKLKHNTATTTTTAAATGTTSHSVSDFNQLLDVNAAATTGAGAGAVDGEGAVDGAGAAASTTCNLLPEYANLSEPTVLHGYEQTISEQFNTSLDTFDEGKQTSTLTAKASSKINDFLKEFEQHCLQENDNDVENEHANDSDTDMHSQQQQQQQNGQTDHQAEPCTEMRAQQMHEVECALNGILNEMQDQHIYTPVSHHADDLFSHSVYSSPISEQRDTSTHYNNHNSPMSSSTCMNSSSATSSPFVQHIDHATQNHTNIFATNFNDYKECFAESTQQSEFIGFQNDIPCFENITFNYAAHANNAASNAQNAAQKQQEPLMQPHDVAANQPHTPLDASSHPAQQHMQLNTYTSAAQSPYIEPACAVATSDDTALQLTQLLNDFEQGTANAAHETPPTGEVMVPNMTIATVVDNQGIPMPHAAGAHMNGQHVAPAAMSTSPHDNTAVNYVSSVLTPTHTIQWTSTDPNTGTTYIINSSDIYQPHLAPQPHQHQQQQQQHPHQQHHHHHQQHHQQHQINSYAHQLNAINTNKATATDANENYMENPNVANGAQQPPSYMIVIPPEYIQQNANNNNSNNASTLYATQQHGDGHMAGGAGGIAGSSAGGNTKTILYEAAMQAHNSSINKDHLLIDLPVHSPSEHRRPVPPSAANRVNLVCRFCHKRTRFTNNLDYSNHIIATHPVENPFNCPYCPQYFTRRFKREKHILVSHTLNRFQCGQCGQIFSAQRGLDVHLQRAHAPDTQHQQNQSHQPLQQHQQQQQQQQQQIQQQQQQQQLQLQQPQQQQQHQPPQQQQQQQQQHKQQKRHYQHQSNAKTSDGLVHVEDIQLHVSDEVKEKKPINLLPEDNEELSTNAAHSGRILCCPDCDEYISDPEHTRDSSQPPHTNSKYSTAISMPSPVQVEPDSTSTTTSLRQFRKRRMSQIQCDNIIHKTNASNKITSNTLNSSSNAAVVRGGVADDPLAIDEPSALRSSHNCLFCDEQFTNEISLRKHHQLAHGNHTPMPFTCSICKRGYRMRSALQRHMESHEEEGRPYECVLCHVRFPRPSQLTLHKLAVHSTKKPFACTECGKQFGTDSILRTHMKFHGERKFQCDQCDRAFFQQKDLIRHQRIHTGELFYKCEFCDKSFLHYTRLIAHINVHVPLGTSLDENAVVPVNCNAAPNASEDDNSKLQHLDSAPATPLDSTQNATY